METAKLQVNGKSFVPGFGMKFFRLLSEKWEVNSINGVVNRLVNLENITDDVTFEQIATITDMICASIETNPDNTEVITADEIADLFLLDTTSVTVLIESIMKGFMDSMPKAKEVGKQVAAKKK